jgi:Holliday junction resolvase RusA-like endonuclease
LEEEMNPAFSFFASGEPKGQPRARAFARKFGDKFSARVYDPGTAEGWKAQVAIAAKPYLPQAPHQGPLEVNLTFFFPRPRKHFRTGKRAHELRPDAPVYHIAKPDRDNSDKAVLDALTQLGMWGDDCQACAGKIRKLYADNGKVGCLIEIVKLEEVSNAR